MQTKLPSKYCNVQSKPLGNATVMQRNFSSNRMSTGKSSPEHLAQSRAGSLLTRLIALLPKGFAGATMQNTKGRYRSRVRTAKNSHFKNCQRFFAIFCSMSTVGRYDTTRAAIESGLPIWSVRGRIPGCWKYEELVVDSSFIKHP